MTIPELNKWAKEILINIAKKQIKYEEKQMPKIEAYLQMIIARSEIIMKETIRINRFTEDINDGLKQLGSRGVKLPNQPEQAVPNNPLKP